MFNDKNDIIIICNLCAFNKQSTKYFNTYLFIGLMQNVYIFTIKLNFFVLNCLKNFFLYQGIY
jgi:hypothetical protein